MDYTTHDREVYEHDYMLYEKQKKELINKIKKQKIVWSEDGYGEDYIVDIETTFINNLDEDKIIGETFRRCDPYKLLDQFKIEGLLYYLIKMCEDNTYSKRKALDYINKQIGYDKSFEFFDRNHKMENG